MAEFVSNVRPKRRHDLVALQKKPQKTDKLEKRAEGKLTEVEAFGRANWKATV